MTCNYETAEQSAINLAIIRIQDAMPAEIRNSTEWKRLLPLAAGTGRGQETEIAAVALDWMWTVVLPQLQPSADKRGFGAEWLRMTTGKTREAALSAKEAAFDAPAAAVAADAAATAAAYGTFGRYAAAAVDAAVDAAAYVAVDAAALKTFWAEVDPCALLAAMIMAASEVVE